MVVVLLKGVSQLIFFSTTIRTPSSSPSRFDSHQKKPPNSLLGWAFPLQTTPLSSSIFSGRNRTLPLPLLCCRCTPNSNDTFFNWDWNQWCHYFHEIERAENFAYVLTFLLEDAVEREDFREAARLKRSIDDATSKDTVAEIMSQLKHAIDDERYHDASRLCRYTGSGLVGWWAGYSKDSEDPFGRIIHISPGLGRFVGTSYSPRQLLSESAGTPIFEIYVVKNADNTYHMQVVYLRRPEGNSMSNPPSIPAESPSKPKVENASSVEVQEHEEKLERNDEKNSNIEGATEEGIKSVINFLKEKIPGMKVKVMNINVEEEEVEDNDSIKQFMEEDSNITSSSENPEEEVNDLDEPDGDTLEVDGDALEEEKDVDVKIFIGGVLHNKEDTTDEDDFIRLPAEIRNMERDSFVLHAPRRYPDHDRREDKATIIKVAALAANGVSELMPPEVAKALWKSSKASYSKVSKSMREIVKLAISRAQERRRLSEDTYFSRITNSKGDFDPFDGLFVGAFGPYGMEIVQLRRKFGHWNDVENENNTSDMEFCEYVEAVKLTGDINVPAGQVTFRAKLGRANRNRGEYPDEFGVVAFYKGQGRIADVGFKNPKWVNGELLLFNGKGMRPYMKGADLGFLYAVPDKGYTQSFIVLFNRLKLPEGWLEHEGF